MNTINKFELHELPTGVAYAVLAIEMDDVGPRLPIAFMAEDDATAKAGAETFIAGNGLPPPWRAAPVCCCVLAEWRSQAVPGRQLLFVVDPDLAEIYRLRTSTPPVEPHLNVFPVLATIDEGCQLANGTGAHWGRINTYCVQRPTVGADRNGC